MNIHTPNILFLFTDDQRYDTIRALGNEQIYTPNLDKLVKNGTAFTNATIMGGTSAAICMPSRAMMLTGRNLFRIEGSGEAIPEQHVTLPEYFRQLGYETFGTGKWHNGPESFARSFSAGAEIFFGGMDDHWNVPACDFAEDGNYPPLRSHPISLLPGTITHIDKQYDHITSGKHSTELFADATCAFLTEHDTVKPFFAYVSFMAPHDPRTMPQDFLEMYDPDSLTLPPNFMPRHPFDNGALFLRDEKLAAMPRQEQEIRQHLAEYYAMISHLDSEIGRIMQALQAIGEYENTIILLAGDNGLALGQHGLMGKQNLYDHSVRVPLIMSGPGVPAGEIRTSFCYLSDIFPTLCDLVERPIPQSVESISLYSALHNPEYIHRGRLYFAYKDLQRAVMTPEFKLIEYTVADIRTTQMFSRAVDAWETINLADDPGYYDTVAELRTDLNDWYENRWEKPKKV